MSPNKPTAIQVEAVTRVATGQDHFEAGDVKDPELIKFFQDFSQAINDGFLQEKYAELRTIIVAALSQAYSLGIVDRTLGTSELVRKIAEFASRKARSLAALKRPEQKTKFLFEEARKAGLFGDKQTSASARASTNEQQTSDKKLSRKS